MESTYTEMTVEHLGPEATESDLAEFRAACIAYRHRTGCTALEATDHVWGQGDYWDRMQAELAR